MRVRPRRSALPVALGLARAAPATATADDGGSAGAEMGTTSARITWEAAEVGVVDVHLTVTRGGATTFDGHPFVGGDCEAGGCSLAPPRAGAIAAYTADLYLLGRGKRDARA